MNRPARRGLETTNSKRAERAAEPGAAAIGTSGAPAMNAMTNTMQPSTIAEPRSLCTRHSPAPTTATTSTGTQRALRVVHLRLGAWSAGWRSTAGRPASRTPTAGTMNGPMATHALASLTSVADAGDERQQHHAARHDQRREHQPAPEVVRHAHRRSTDRPMPSTAHISCLLKMPPRRVALVELGDRRLADSTITRPSMTNTATTTAISVERDRRRRSAAATPCGAGRMPAHRRGALERLAAAVADHGGRSSSSSCAPCLRSSSRTNRLKSSPRAG